ncbi:Rossmann-like and DUF2520 domain-containing protein [Reichenbachiella sp.]|uniref:Rossmann-like and DUF2520 domain-containing protein n=1 Tax=Reichenbachiella sp. TaxID=2184521 RepID=UPI003BB064F2
MTKDTQISMADNFDNEVSIIGTGRVAISLIHELRTKGVKVNEIYGRSLAQAKKLSDHTPGTSATGSLDFSNSRSRVLIIAISDDAISHISEKILCSKDQIIAHTSGTVSLNVLKHSHSGIFYPLQTFTTGKMVDFEEVPILIDGKNEIAIDQLTKLGNVLSSNVKIASEAERKQLHVAAVFASNFTNRMLSAAEDILKDSSIDLKTLEPLILESIRNALDSGPDNALTGPAKRGDTETIEKHLNLLKDKKQLQSIYGKITELIISKI